ncbi:MAG: class I SAM-dependent methyltransferase [Mastigocoleus sp.]
MNIRNYKQQLITDFDSRQNYDQGRFKILVANELVEHAKLKPGQKVLDIATGTGLVALNAAQKVTNQGKVIGVDISSGMLLKAREKLEISGLHNVEFIEADVEEIDFAEGSFDVILCSLAACYLTDISNAFQNWYKWLNPQGMIIFNAWEENAFPPSVIFRQVTQSYGITIPNPNESLGTKQRCYELLQAANFRDIEIEEKQFGWYFQDIIETAQGGWKGNSQNAFGYQVLELPKDKLEECKAEYIKKIENLPQTNDGVWCNALIFNIKAYK